jgi:hypothetical protein
LFMFLIIYSSPTLVIEKIKDGCFIHKALQDFGLAIIGRKGGQSIHSISRYIKSLVLICLRKNFLNIG